jgi:hypothetical protein
VRVPLVQLPCSLVRKPFPGLARSNEQARPGHEQQSPTASHSRRASPFMRSSSRERWTTDDRRPCHGASVPSLGLRRVPALRAGPHVLALSTRWHRPALHRPRAAHSLVSSEASPGRLLPPSRRRCAPKGGCVATGGIACPGALTRAGPALVAACCVAYTHAWMVRSRGDVAVRVSRSI